MDLLVLEQLTKNQIPKVVEDQFDKQKNKMDICNITDKSNGEYYIMITMGAKYTGGFSMEVSRVVEQEDFYIVDIAFKGPQKNNYLIQEITYPSLVFKKHTTKKIKIRILQGKKKIIKEATI